MKYFLFIKPGKENNGNFFYKSKKAELLRDYIKNNHPDIQIICIESNHYLGIIENSIFTTDKKIFILDVVGVYFSGSDGNKNKFPYLFDLCNIYKIPININSYSCLIRSKVYQSIMLQKLQLDHPITGFFIGNIENESIITTFRNMTDNISGSKIIIKGPKSCNGSDVHCIDKENISEKNKLEIKSIKDPEEGLLIQEYISGSEGRDIRCIIVQGKVKIIYTRYNPDNFKSNISTGGEMTILEKEYFGDILQEKIQSYATKLFEYTKMPYFTLDFLFPNNNNLIICEINPVGTYYSSYYKTTMDLFSPIVKSIMTDIYKL